MSSQQNNNNNQQQNNNPFGSRFGKANNNNQSVPAPASPPPPRPFSRPPIPNPNQRSWQIQPLVKTVVRFELKGLGDPFYRLLDHELNPNFGDFRNVATTLEQGGEAVEEMRQMLDNVWEQYKLDGAFLVYNWNTDLWRAISTPPPSPQPQQQDSDDYADDQPVIPPQAQQPLFHCLRALDLELVLNVLARSRSQLLITKAPLVFSQQYLTRSIMSDDPRLLALARATGYLEES